MNYFFTGTLIILMVLLAIFVTPAYPAETQTNISGINKNSTAVKILEKEIELLKVQMEEIKANSTNLLAN